MANDQISPIPIVYEDDAILVVDKPAGVVVHPAKGHHGDTLVELLGERLGGGESDRPGVAHRLDKDTSGLLVMARNDDAHAALSKAIQERAVEREYLALVVGRPGARSGAIDAPLGRARRDRTRMSLDSDRPRDAITHFTTERVFTATTLLRLKLETGRTHQIRVHLEAIGTPIVGDQTYNDSRFETDLERQFLHATRLAFSHPITGEALEFHSALPQDLSDVLKTLS